VLSRPAVKRRLEQVAGVVFIGFGVRLALDSHRTSG
jgi:threonine/homoserine/homoserine lactone efflux protein